MTDNQQKALRSAKIKLSPLMLLLLLLPDHTQRNANSCSFSLTQAPNSHKLKKTNEQQQQQFVFKLN